MKSLIHDFNSMGMKDVGMYRAKISNLKIHTLCLKQKIEYLETELQRRIMLENELYKEMRRMQGSHVIE